MVLYFHSSRLQKLCCNEKEIVRKLGAACGRKLMQRLQELRAVQSLADISHLPPSRCHELTGNRKEQLSVDLQHPYRLLFIPANEPVPHLPEGSLDWTRITEVEIIEITDTH